MDENTEIKTKITDLNIDCYIEICRNLNHSDLYNLKLAHDAFGDAIDHVVRTTEFDFVVTDTKGEISEDGKTFEGFVELFGREMKWLNIKFAFQRGIAMSTRIESLIENYCVNGNIKHCKFFRFRCNQSFFERNVLFFRSLKTLKLSYWYEPINLDWLMKFISKSKNIKEFYFNCLHECKATRIFHSLSSSELEICHLDFPTTLDLPRKMKMPMNYTLKELNLGSYRYDPAILTSFPNIESVKIHHHTKCSLDPNPILTLPALKTLKLSCQEPNAEVLSFLTKLAVQNRLESLSLYQFGSQPNQTETEAHLVNILCRMTNLKKLELKTCFRFEEYLSRIGNCLTNLREFSFYGHSYLGLNERKKLPQNLLEFVKMAKKLTAIKCEYFHALDAHELFKKFVNIRKEQGNMEILFIYGCRNNELPTLSDEQSKYIKFVERKTE